MMFRVLLLPALVLQACVADILWQNCVGKADHGIVERGRGHFFDLCIKKHEFVQERHSWQFVDTNIFETEFKACTFVNDPKFSVNFTKATFTDVKFTKCIFGAYTSHAEPMKLEKMVMRTVTFDSCTFDKSAELLFSEFSMLNVTFKNCQFESDTVFQLAEITDVTFHDCSFKRFAKDRTGSLERHVTFDRMTMRDVTFSKNIFLRPLIFESVNAADLSFNDTKFEDFFCHSISKKKEELKTSAFNDTLFDSVVFNGKVTCDSTTWRRFQMYNAKFRQDASFANSNIEDIYWDKVETEGDFTGGCTTLDFSKTKIFRDTIANVTTKCELDLSETDIEIVRIKNVRASVVQLKDATFTGQQRIDGRCCTEICPDRDCRCNYTRPETNDACPSAPYPIDLNAKRTCFPAGATVQSVGGATIRMADLRHGEQVAVGDGHHSDVYFFGHRERNAMTQFVEIEHSSANSPLRMSPGHYIYANDRLVTADTVKAGHTLRDADGYSVFVTSVRRVTDAGLYAPASLHGDLIVDGIRVSSYTSALHPTLAHWLLSPLRLAYSSGMRTAVEKFALFHHRGMEHVARFLRLPQGPNVVEL